jgi:hypothetical protein
VKAVSGTGSQLFACRVGSPEHRAGGHCAFGRPSWCSHCAPRRPGISSSRSTATRSAVLPHGRRCRGLRDAPGRDTSVHDGQPARPLPEAEHIGLLRLRTPSPFRQSGSRPPTGWRAPHDVRPRSGRNAGGRALAGADTASTGRLAAAHDPAVAGLVPPARTGRLGPRCWTPGRETVTHRAHRTSRHPFGASRWPKTRASRSAARTLLCPGLRGTTEPAPAGWRERAAGGQWRLRRRRGSASRR